MSLVFLPKVGLATPTAKLSVLVWGLLPFELMGCRATKQIVQKMGLD